MVAQSSGGVHIFNIPAGRIRRVLVTGIFGVTPVSAVFSVIIENRAEDRHLLEHRLLSIVGARR